ncbi:MAG: response regulator [Bdellovibrio sp.]|nr:response regulator [Bdellovibrio sp.]
MAKTVLVVDDIAFVRKTLTQILTDAQYQVVGEAADGNEAVNLFAKFKPDIVTMDLVMPNLSGIEATRKILRIDKNAKVVIISAMGQENLIMEAINVGVKDYILKPFVAEDIIRTLERALLGEQNVLGRSVSKGG